jgi:hypothetical protein
MSGYQQFNKKARCPLQRDAFIELKKRGNKKEETSSVGFESGGRKIM